MKYFALTADIVQSRSQQNRNELQKNIAAVLKQINEKQNFLISPYTITISDDNHQLEFTSHLDYRDTSDHLLDRK